MRKQKELKAIKIGKDEKKLSPLRDNMILYLGNQGNQNKSKVLFLLLLSSKVQK